MLFIEASREFREGSAQNYLREGDVTKIAETFHAFGNVQKYAQVVDLEEIERNNFNLNISRYVATGDIAEKVDVAHAVARLREVERHQREATAKLDIHLRELGYEG